MIPMADDTDETDGTEDTKDTNHTGERNDSDDTADTDYSHWTVTLALVVVLLSTPIPLCWIVSCDAQSF